jgi:hypothetical protein
MIDALALWAMLSLAQPKIQCPAYPGDPPWRPCTCFILAHMGTPPDREPFKR